MNRFKYVLVACAVVSIGITTWGGEAKTNKVLRMAVDLADGSHLVGIPAIKTIRLQTPYALVDIPLVQTRSITLEKDRESAVFEMVNGDRLKGAMLFKKLDLQTVFGKVAIGAEQIVNIDIISGGRMPAELLKALTLYYSFDKDEKDLVADLSGKGNSGKLHGTEWMARGKVGGARTFNGKSDYISIDYDQKSGLFPTDVPLSVAVWFKTSVAVPIYQVLVATHYAGAGRDGYLLVVDAKNYASKAEWAPAIPGAETISLSAVNDGQWHHVAGVWDGKKSFLYIDGIPQGTAQAAGPLIYPHRASFQIGHAPNNNAPHARDEFYYFNGSIDEVMVFDRALSAEDVRVLFTGSK